MKFAAAILRKSEEIHRSPLVYLAREPGRDVILPTSRRVAERVHTLAMASVLDGRPFHLIRGASEVLNASRFDDWNPVHFLDTAEMMAAVALGWQWFGSVMSRQDKHEIERAIVEKGMLPGLDALRSHYFWVDSTTNWNVVCCAGLIVAATALRNHERELCAEVLARSHEAIQLGLSSFEPDGGYEEGPGYWEYAVLYATIAQTASNEAGLNVPEGLRWTWRYGMEMTAPSGDVFNYGDTLLKPPRSPVLGWLAQASGDGAAADWQRQAPGEPHAFDLFWFSQNPRPRIEAPSAAAFEPAGVSVLRVGGNEGVWLALKGGRNSANHAHLDLGTFVLEFGGRRFASEIGRENYSAPGYFDPERRFQYFRTTTAAHNTLVVDGQNQSTEARATLIGTSENRDRVAAAYSIDDPISPLIVHRGIEIDAAGRVRIVDELQRRPDRDRAVRLEWRMYTQAVPEVNGSLACLSLDGHAITLQIEEPRDAAWTVTKALSPLGESDNSAFTCLLFVATCGEETMRLVVSISDEAAEDAGKHRQVTPINQWNLTRKTRHA